MSRRGFSLAELVVAVTITAAVVALSWGSFMAAAVRLRDRSERAGLAQTLRTASEALRTALEDLGADSAGGTDLISLEADRVRYRATRFIGLVCDVAPPRLLIRHASSSGGGRRQPVPGKDSAMVLSIDAPDRWLVASVSGSTAGEACPDGQAATAVSVELDSAGLAAVGRGSVIRVFETVEARRYGSGSSDWLGLQSLSSGETVQPLAGPLLSGGFAVLALALNGVGTGSPSEASALRVLVLAGSRRDLGVGLERRGANAHDSIEGFVLLRNRP